LEEVEVVDNGKGVLPQDYASLARKYCTSKLTNFDDLLRVTSFGFRGEALSSLCAIGNMTVITKSNTSNSPCGDTLQFDGSGELIKKTSNPAKTTQGTIVTLKNLFSSMPVRRMEFTKNQKKEFLKVQSLVQAYCIICLNTRIRLFHHTQSK
jgi:DNA mismatch repair protein PMS2